MAAMTMYQALAIETEAATAEQIATTYPAAASVADYLLGDPDIAPAMPPLPPSVPEQAHRETCSAWGGLLASVSRDGLPTAVET